LTRFATLVSWTSSRPRMWRWAAPVASSG